MNNKLSLSDIAALLAERTGRDRKTAESFLRELIAVVSDGLDADKLVKIKGLGTFKIIPVEQRESVHVHTGERFVIPAHYKYSFLPDKELRDTVNAPFSFFETTEIGPDVDFSDLEESVEEEPNAEEESVEELLPETGSPDEPIENREPSDRVPENPDGGAAAEDFSSFSGTVPEGIAGENGVSDDRLPADAEQRPVNEQRSAAVPASCPADRTRPSGTEPAPLPEVPDCVPEEVPAKAGAFDPDDACFPELTPAEPEAVSETGATGADDRPAGENVSFSGTVPELPDTSGPVSGKAPVYKRDWFIAVCILCAFIGLSAGLYRWYVNRPLHLVAAGERKPAGRETPDRASCGLQPENGEKPEMTADWAAVADSLAGNRHPALLEEPGRGDSVARPLPEEARDLPVVPADSSAQETPAAASAAENPSGEAAPRWIGEATIAPGDRLTLIALKHYGHKFFWVYIYKANRDVIRDPNNIPIGTVLKLPAPQTYGIDARSRASVARAAALQARILRGEEP